MASVFIKVDPKERLPKKYGSYICLYNNSKNVQVTIFDRKSEPDFWRKAFDFWLEEVELSSEEEILEATLIKQEKYQTHFMRGIDFILNKLKRQ